MLNVLPRLIAAGAKLKEKGRFGANLYSADANEEFRAWAEKRKSKDKDSKFLNHINNGQVAVRIENLEYLPMKVMQHIAPQRLFHFLNKSTPNSNWLGDGWKKGWCLYESMKTVPSDTPENNAIYKERCIVQLLQQITGAASLA